MAQSSFDDHELLYAITDDAKYDQVFDQCQETQKATLRAAKIMIATSSQPVKSYASTQIGPSRVAPRLPQFNLPSFRGNFTALQSFIDQFGPTINDNEKLSPVQKLLSQVLFDEPCF